MSAELPKSDGPKKSEPKPKASAASAAKAATPAPSPVAPLFQAVDWLTFAITTLVVFIGYYFSLAPDLTLEDSGELAVGSFYAGVPHPPGYPVWTLFTWLICELVPFNNIAWRVALASAICGALGCGLLSMMVSRGSAMIIEGFETLRGIESKVRNGICMMSGYVGGMVMAFNGYLWSQAVIVEVYAISVLSLVLMLVSIMRWMHAPHQSRYIWWASFWLGICFTNHQTLLVAVLGLQVAVLARDAKLGRDVFFGNIVIFMLAGIGMLVAFGGVKGIADSGFNLAYVKSFVIIGLASIVVTGALLIHTGGKLGSEFVPAFGMAIAFGLGAGFYLYMPLAGMTIPPMQWGYPRTIEGFKHALTRGQYEKGNPTSGLDRFFGQIQTYVEASIEEMNLVLLVIGLIPLAVIFYRRIEPQEKVWLGVISAFYGFFCLLKLTMNFAEYRPVVPGMICGYVFLLIGIIPFLFFRHAGGRPERAWLAGLTTVFLFLSLMLIYLLNPPPDRQSQGLNKVFFTASYVPISMLVGYGLAMIAAAAVANYAVFRRWLLIGSSLAGAVAWYAHDINKVEYPLAIFTTKFGMGLSVAFIALFLFARTRLPVTLMLALFCALPAHTILSHWAENEQRGHRFGYWFGHDMFTPPFEDSKGNLSYDRKERETAQKDPARAKFTYPEMTRDTVLYGGTDPGRFCPTYMIFCESFIKPEQRHNPDFDRRDVYLITQNALADATYLMYIRSHYNRSNQKDPPFFAGTVDYLQGIVLGSKARNAKAQGQPYETGGLAKLVGLLHSPAKPLDSLFGDNIGKAVERNRRAGSSLFKADHFTNVKSIAAQLQPGPKQDALAKWLHEQLTPDTRALLASGSEAALRKALAREFNTLIEREMSQRWVIFEDLHRIHAEYAEAEARASQQGNELQSSIQNQAQQQKADVKMLQQTLARVQAETAQKLRSIQDAREKAKQARREQFQNSPAPFYHPDRFGHLKLDSRMLRFARQDLTWASIRLNRILLETAYPDAISKSEGGVYPDLEIQSATVEDSSKAFSEYVEDARRRLDHDQKLPNEPRQIKPGEDVRYDEATGRIQVSGQVAVMAINGLLTKVMFDKNPDHDFYVEESFPLEWMYPHLTPSGIIMKINRQPLVEMTQEVVDRDHQFWSKYSERLIGNWLTYDTSVSNICRVAEQVYIKRNYENLKVDGVDVKPDSRFVRDDDAQKAFSKLRSAIAGVYFWRINEAGRKGNECAQRGDAAGQSRHLAEQQRMIRECDFAFRQAFAFCPFSPEAVFRYANLLMSLGKFDDALLIARTFQKLDPNNASAKGLIEQLLDVRKQIGANQQMQRTTEQAQNKLIQLDGAYRANPANAQVGLQYAAALAQSRRTNDAVAVLDTLAQTGSNNAAVLLPVTHAYNQLGQTAKAQLSVTRLLPLCEQILADPLADNNSLQAALQTYQILGHVVKMEESLQRLVKLHPTSPELSYDLGALLTFQRKTNAAIGALSNSIHHSNARLKQAPAAQDLRALAAGDTNYIPLRAHPEFPKLVAPK